MSLSEHYNTEALVQLRSVVQQQLNATQMRQLSELLDLTVIKVLLNNIKPAEKSQTLQLLRAGNDRLIAWTDQAYPTMRLSVTEALTRVLLSLTVE